MRSAAMKCAALLLALAPTVGTALAQGQPRCILHVTEATVTTGMSSGTYCAKDANGNYSASRSLVDRVGYQISFGTNCGNGGILQCGWCIRRIVEVNYAAGGSYFDTSQVSSGETPCATAGPFGNFYGVVTGTGPGTYNPLADGTVTVHLYIYDRPCNEVGTPLLPIYHTEDSETINQGGWYQVPCL